MNKLTRCIIVILTASVAGLGSGCGTKSTAPTVVVDARKLPGTDEVTAALEKKDYDGAMAAWLKVKQSVATEEQRAQFMLLTREVNSKVLEAAQTDPKAAEAAAVLRQMTLGR